MNVPKKYMFIDNFDTNLIDKQDVNTGFIFRNYKSSPQLDLILKIKNYCKKNNKKFYLSNNFKLAIKLDLDGAYLPSFNSSFDHLSYSLKPDFLLLGSAHNFKQIKIKENQKVKIIFISSLFKKNKNFLGINKFKIISKITKKKVVALGGISETNIKKLNLLRCFGFAGITYFKKKAP